MDNQKACLYSTKWQSLRVSLLAQNNEWGGFGDIDGVKKNIKMLDEYLDGSNDLPTLDEQIYESFLRQWRVLNLMNATLLGYGERYAADDERRRLVTEFRDHLSGLHKKALQERMVFELWNWEKEEEDVVMLINQGEQGRRVFSRIWMNLLQRVGTANRKEKAGTGGMDHRKELALYLDILERVGRSYRINKFGEQY